MNNLTFNRARIDDCLKFNAGYNCESYKSIRQMKIFTRPLPIASRSTFFSFYVALQHNEIRALCALVCLYVARITRVFRFIGGKMRLTETCTRRVRNKKRVRISNIMKAISRRRYEIISTIIIRRLFIDYATTFDVAFNKIRYILKYIKVI